MACRSCGTELSADARFCPSCGTPATSRCAACDAELTAGANFCQRCGTRVQAAAAAAPGNASSPSSPPVAERRMTSVLFGDLVGFTTISESRDPEEVRDLLSRYFDAAREIVARYGGTIEKFIGDAVMAVWGVPTAHEDDAERAVRAGLDLVDAVAAFGDEVGVSDLAMRVGVVTGEVAVTLGATNQGMVAGDAVNTAARVQAKADPGSVWVDAQTRALTVGSIDFSDAGTHELKGKAEPVALFAATAVMGNVGGERSSDRVQAPLVGRRRELSMIKEMFHAAAEERSPRLLVLSGDAGVGKTRLSWEVEKYIDGLSADVLWHRGRCLAYGDGVAYSALTSAVRARIGANDNDTELSIRDKLTASLADYVSDAAERGWLEGALAGLLGLPVAGGQSRADLFAAWLTWFERLSGKQGDPIVWVIDDAHHADDALLDFVEHLATAGQTPLLVVVLARPELLARRPGLAVLRRASVIGLENLSRADVAALLDGLVEGLPDDVRETLVRRAEGNPLYAIETVRSLHDQGLTVTGPTRTPGAVRLAPGVDAASLDAVAPPASLQVLIASRLDRLSPAAHAVLAAAAVLGQTFTMSALAATCDREGDLPELVRELIARDLLTAVNDRLSGEDGQYAFMQTVVRTVAYQTQSRRDRLERHLRVVRYLESIAESDGAISTVIAQHLRDALDLVGTGEPDRRRQLVGEFIVWLQRSAERSLAVGAPAAALAALEQALEFVVAPGDHITLHLAAAHAATAAGEFESCIAHAFPIATGESAAGPAERADAAASTASAFRYAGRSVDAIALLEPYLETGALDRLPPLIASRVARQVCAALSVVGRNDERIVWDERALLLAEDTGRPDQVAASLVMMALGLSHRGQHRLSDVLLKYAADYCRETHQATDLARALVNQLATALNRDLDTALASGAEALQVASQTGNPTFAGFAVLNLGIGLVRAGRWDELDELRNQPVLADRTLSRDDRVFHVWADSAVALARGESLDLPEEWASAAPGGGDGRGGGDWAEDTIDTLALVMERAVAARHRRDTAALTGACQRMVALGERFMGLGDDFPLLWSTAINWLVDCGEYGRARELLPTVLDVPPARWSPYLAAAARQLRGTIEALDPASTADPASVEADLRAAITALDEFGALPDRARTQATLGRWLVGQGRPADAAAHLIGAREGFEQLGATAWLREIDAYVPARAVG